MTPPRYRIGIDGGGTGTRARLLSADGLRLAEGRAGPSGLGGGAAAAWEAVGEAVAASFQAAGLSPAAPGDCEIGLGLAGAGRQVEAQAFMAANPGYARLVLTRDIHALLIGAFADAPGIVVAIGTGSVAAARWPDGQLRLAGGWGYPLGDEGGGAWLGQQALRLAQAAADGREPETPFSRAILAAAGGSAEALAACGLAAGQTACAALAPRVLACADQGDPQAWALLALAAEETARLVLALQPAAAPALPVVVAGSLGPRISAGWPAALRAGCVAARGDACEGALQLLAQDRGEPMAAPAVPDLPRRSRAEVG